MALIFVMVFDFCNGFYLTQVLRLFNIYTVGSGEELPAAKRYKLVTAGFFNSNTRTQR